MTTPRDGHLANRWRTLAGVSGEDQSAALRELMDEYERLRWTVQRAIDIRKATSPTYKPKWTRAEAARSWVAWEREARSLLACEVRA